MGTALKYIRGIAARNVVSLQVMLLTLLLAFSIPAAAKDVGEYHIKAVFLFNLTHFVSWPADSGQGGEDFIIGIYGPDPFGPIIDTTVVGEKKNNRPVKVVRYSDLQGIDPNNCNILFIHASKLTEWEHVRQHLSGYPVLSVADTAGFPEQEGMVNLLKTGQKIQVEINLGAVQKSGLSISSKLLSLARIVP